MKGRPPAQKPPQAKKADSYAKDRRNRFGENSKASRKAIPRRKAGENRMDRRAVNQAMSHLPRLDDGEAGLIERSAQHDTNRLGGWKKSSDVPLAEYLEQKKRLRERR